MQRNSILLSLALLGALLAMPAAADEHDDGVVPEAWGEIGDVTVSNDETHLEVRLELAGTLDGAAPLALHAEERSATAPFSYSVSFKTSHNTEQVYGLRYSFDAVDARGEADAAQPLAHVFDLTVNTQANSDGFSSSCVVDADLSQSAFDDESGEAVWVVPLAAFNHDTRPTFDDGCAAFTHAGEPLTLGDELTDIAGAAKVALAVLTINEVGGDPVGDRSTHEDYTIAGEVAFTATLAAAPTNGNAPLDVTFQASVDDPNGQVTDWSLDVDDDGQPEYIMADDEALPVSIDHTYEDAGLYTARLTAFGAGGQHDATVDVTVSVGALQASAGGPYSGLVEQAIPIAASHTGGPSGTATCAWSGTGATFSAADACSTTVAFAAAGSHTVSVTMTKGDETSTASASVTVSAHSDGDSDDVPDFRDNCAALANADQADLDGDGAGDLCDADRDNDGFANDDDNCPSASNPGQEDKDDDGVGDVCDTDRDGDGVANAQDNCPGLANGGQADLDSDDVGDACDPDTDGDGMIDTGDNCLGLANDQNDTDHDGTGDACDDDIDGDEVQNQSDNCPLVVNAGQADADSDGIGDRCDDDADGDGTSNGADSFPLDGQLMELGDDAEPEGAAAADKESPGVALVLVLAGLAGLALRRRH